MHATMSALGEIVTQIPEEASTQQASTQRLTLAST